MKHLAVQLVTLALLSGCASHHISTYDENYARALKNCLSEEPKRIDRAEAEAAHYTEIQQRLRTLSEFAKRPDTYKPEVYELQRGTAQERTGAEIYKWSVTFNNKRSQIPATCAEKARRQATRDQAAVDGVSLPVVFTAPLY
jgi:hypothetical protein